MKYFSSMFRKAASPHSRVIWHFHIFKNAGTTFDAILERNFAKRAFRVDPESANNLISMETAMGFIAGIPRTQSLSSHRFEVNQLDTCATRLMPVVFIRHPIDRLVSVYHYHRKSPKPKNAVARAANKLSLVEYIQWLLSKKKNRLARNMQTAYLACLAAGEAAQPDSLAAAQANLENFPVVGIVDRFDESMVFAESVFRPFFQGLDLSYTRKNVTAGNVQTLPDKLALAREALGEALAAELEQYNQLDLELYQWANQLLDNRLSSTENAKASLAEFTSRCQHRRAETVDEGGPMLKSRKLRFSHDQNHFYYLNEKKNIKKVILRLS